MRLIHLCFSSLVTVSALAQAAAFGSGGFDPDQDVTLAFRKGAVELALPARVHVTQDSLKVRLLSKPGRLKVGPLPTTSERDESGTPIYHGTLRIPVQAEGIQGTATLAVGFQSCTEGEGGSCFPPTEARLQVPAEALGVPMPPRTEAAATPEARVEAPPSVAPNAVSAPTSPAKPTGLIWAFLVAFAAGLAASLTPCVFPMIPITLAIIGAKEGGKRQGFLRSSALVLGMAATYATLGVIAARTGATFGAFAQKPAFLIPVSALFGLFALSLFGAFEIQLPASLQAKLQGSGPRKGYLGAFAMGLVLGPLAAPCVGPIVGSILVDVAQRGSVLLGALQLFVFSLGMGMLFLAVGTFSVALPKSGDWLIRFKRILGLLVLGFAAWSLRLILPAWANFAVAGAVALIGAAVFGAFEPAGGFVAQIRKAFALLLLVLGIFLGIRAVEQGFGVGILGAGAREAAPKTDALWMEQDFEGAQARAKAEGKVLLVDTYADWCAQCKELDEKTWPDPALRAWITRNAIPLRVDPEAKRPDLKAPLKLRSYPTVILLDAEGREKGRIQGFLGPEKMLAWLQGL